MVYTVNNLISDAYYTSGIVSREFQEVQGSQSQDGLNLLNEILSDKVVEEDMIPYWTTGYEFTAVIGQEKYFIPNLISAETLVFFINTIRYNMARQQQDQYFGSARANNINSLPFTYYEQRVLGGSNIFLYYFPNQAYTMQLTGFFRLSAVTINQDLDLTLDQFYISYLKYRLCDKLCTAFNYTLPPGPAKELLRYEEMITKRSAPMDLRINNISVLGNEREMVNYSQANLGHGWTTG
jgi:hypothetical protein